MLRSFDRRLAALSTVLAVAALLGTNALASDADPLPRNESVPAAPAQQSRALRELTALLERGESTTSWVEYAFRRISPAGPLDADIVDVNRPPDRLEAAFGGLRGTFGRQTIECSPGPDGQVCATSRRPGSESASRAPGIQGLRDAADPSRGWYTVAARPDETILAERAKCFEVAATGRQPRDFYGTATEWCLAADGVILRSGVRRSDSSDTSTAVSVRRRVDDADFSALVEPFHLGRI